MEIDLLASLGEPTYATEPHELWDDAAVRRDERGEWLLNASATAKPGVTAEQIGATLGTTWAADLRYRYREAHTLLTESTAVTLQAVTQIGPGEFWVTVQVRVRLSASPPS